MAADAPTYALRHAMGYPRISKVAIGWTLALATVIFWQSSTAAQEPAETQDPVVTPATGKKAESAALKAFALSKSVYVGATKCKSCHNKEVKGLIYDKWSKLGHAKSIEVLTSEKGLAVAKELGIKKPAEAPECLKCHVTAFGEKKERLHKRFKPNLGVQCESCHGPGSQHVKVRLAAAKVEKVPEEVLQEIPADEAPLPDQLLCLSCHNEESPTYKKFDFGERLEKIRHLHPQREKPRVLPPKKKKVDVIEG